LRAAVLAATFLFAVAACGAGDDADTADADTSLAGGVDATDELLSMELEAFDGTTMRLADLRGQPVVVNFFASWCAPCVREMPEIESVKRQLGDAVMFVGVNVMDDADRADALVADTGVTWRLVRDADGAALRAAGAPTMPITLVLDSEGTIVDAHSGGITDKELLERLTNAGMVGDG
jgi:thiol-disulfide isomerase/thioredoxin